MSYSTKRLLTLLAALAASAALVAGCGDDDNDGGGGDGGGQIGPGATQEDGGSTDGDSKKDDTPTEDEAIDRCYEEADKLSGQAKETARASCRAAETGDTGELQEEVREQCLDAAKQFPDAAARKQAEDACKELGGK